jgi:hypothetical protein
VLYIYNVIDIYILILLFVFLLVYQVYLVNDTFGSNTYSSKLIEGLENEEETSPTTQEYKPYNLNDPNNSFNITSAKYWKYISFKRKNRYFRWCKEKSRR